MRQNYGEQQATFDQDITRIKQDMIKTVKGYYTPQRSFQKDNK